MKQNVKKYFNETEKAWQLKRKIKLEKNNQKILAKEGKSKRYRDKIKQYRQSRRIQDNEKKIDQKFGGKWERKDHNEKSEWINNMETDGNVGKLSGEYTPRCTQGNT